jgi:hypothetical protein
VNPTKLERVTLRLRWILRVFLGLTVLAAAFRLAADGPWALVHLPEGVTRPSGAMPWSAQAVGLLLGGLEPLLWVMGLGLGHRFATLCAERAMFGERGISAIRRLGWVLVLLDVARMVSTAALGPLMHLTLGTPSFITFELQCSVALVGGVLLVLATTMELSRELEESDRLTI